MKRAFVVALAAACTPNAGAGRAALPEANEVAPAGPAVTFGPGPATAVVLLAPNTPTAVLVGPFLVTTINPAGDLELSLSQGSACTSRGLWFSYSGGGVAIGEGQVLCARSRAEHVVVDGFSGVGGVGGTSAVPAAVHP